MRIAEQRAGFSLDAAAPIEHAGNLTAPLLLIHGESDDIVPIEASEQLHAAACCSTLVRVPGMAHIPLSIDRDVIGEHVLPWLDGRVTGRYPGSEQSCTCKRLEPR